LTHTNILTTIGGHHQELESVPEESHCGRNLDWVRIFDFCNNESFRSTLGK